MFKTVIFAEKPSFSTRLLPVLREKFDNSTTLIVHALVSGPAKFRYSRGMSLAQYPLLSNPKYELNPDHNWHGQPLESTVPGEPAAIIPNSESLKALRSAETLIYAADQHPSSINAFWQTVRLTRESPAEEYPAYNIWNSSEEELRKTFSNPTSTRSFSLLAARCEVKRYFEQLLRASSDYSAEGV